MGILTQGDTSTVPRLDFELSMACDHKCGHCYNVWNASEDDPQGGYQKGQLRGQAFLDMMEKAVRESGADHITITGGEPLLHKDAMAILEQACSLVSTVQIITNGSHVTPERARAFKKMGLRSVQLTLLSADPDKHNLLKGSDCFNDTVRAAIDLRDAGVPVQVCFVSMRQNWQDFEEVMELCYLLGVVGIAYNRMSPTGWAVHQIARLLPEVNHVIDNLETAERLGARYNIAVSTAMPIPPCLVRIDRFDWVKFGFCSTGTESPNLTIDPLGNVRSCNLSSELLGNVVEQDWSQIYKEIRHYQDNFRLDTPELCRGCRYERSCQGGCKESAFATFGAVDHPEPFLQMAVDAQWRQRLGIDAPQGDPQLDCPGAHFGRASGAAE